ncbi:MAG: NIL domain-containing protein [Candidatus Omnitrophica bacterium]|nr:NIL domain-containing protein [Candidatus Omnitrophota bacterium]
MKIKTELVFPADLKEEAVICSLCKQFNVVVQILEASFSTDTGWAILIFEGSEKEIGIAFEFLKKKGVRFEEVQTQ